MMSFIRIWKRLPGLVSAVVRAWRLNGTSDPAVAGVPTEGGDFFFIRLQNAHEKNDDYFGVVVCNFSKKIFSTSDTHIESKP